MRIDVLTLFPEVFEPFFSTSIVGRARQAGKVTICCHNIRDYSLDPHGKVDDRPFGGGPGMVMMCQPVVDAVEAVETRNGGPATRVLLTPQGERLTQRIVEELAGRERVILVAGRYEGFDERTRLVLSPREISIGDYVLAGGEAAAMVVVDAVVRLLPGVLGDAESAREESFSVVRELSPGDKEASRTASGAGGGMELLEYPQYTRPRVFRDISVPEILLSGDHGRIRVWRSEQAVRRTQERRPELLSRLSRQDETDGRRVCRD